VSRAGSSPSSAGCAGKLAPSSSPDAQQARLLAGWRRAWWAHRRGCVHTGWGTSPNDMSQTLALAQGTISGKAERGRGHLAGNSKPHHPGCAQRCPGSSRARARRAPCSSRHGPSSTELYLCLHSASDPSGGRLAGVEQEKGREGRERGSAMLAAPRGQEPQPSLTCACSRTYKCAQSCTHTDTRARAYGPTNTHTCVRGPSHTCMHRYVHRPAHTHVHIRAHGPVHTHTHTDLCTWTLHVCAHPQPLLLHTHTHVSMHVCTEPLSTHVCAHRALAHTSVCTQSLDTPRPDKRTDRHLVHPHIQRHGRTHVQLPIRMGTPGCQAPLLRQSQQAGTHARAHAGTRQPPAQPRHSL